MFPGFPYQYRAGWGYQMLTNELPNANGSGASGNGTFKLHAVAFDKVGNQQDLGSKTITRRQYACGENPSALSIRQGRAAQSPAPLS